MAKLLNVLVEPRSSTAVELGKVLQRIDEASEREFFVEFPRPGFDGQKVAAFGVKDEKQAIEEYQTILVELAPVLLRITNMILRAFDKTVGEDFDEHEDTLAQVFFEIGLCSQGTLADLVEPALALGIAHECRRAEQREEDFEIRELFDCDFEIEREEVAGF